MALPNNLVSIVMILDGKVLRLQYSINIVMYGNLALPLVGEIQGHTQIFVGFAPEDFHLPQANLKYTFVLDSKPSNSIINNCREFARDLAVINVETDCYLLSLDHIIDHKSVIWADFVPLLLCETLHKLLVVQ